MRSVLQGRVTVGVGVGWRLGRGVDGRVYAVLAVSGARTGAAGILPVASALYPGTGLPSGWYPKCRSIAILLLSAAVVYPLVLDVEIVIIAPTGSSDLIAAS